MHFAGKIFRIVFAALHVGLILGVSSLAFAQGGEISGSVKDHVSNEGIRWVLITVKDVTNGKVAATVVTDSEGNYSVAVPAMGNYSLEASKRGYGYGKVTAPDLIEISDTIPNQTVDLIMGGTIGLERPLHAPKAASNMPTAATRSSTFPAPTRC